MPAFSAKLGRYICEQIASGRSLTSVCKEEKMPHKQQVIRWIMSDRSPFKKFQGEYAQARQISYEIMADEIFDIADDGSNDWVEKQGKDGSTYMAFDNDHYQRSRLRVDTRKWFLSKVLPKIYGDKVQVDQSGVVEHNHQHTTADDIPFDKIHAKAKAGNTKPTAH